LPPAPTSTVNALPATTAATSFTLTWGGNPGPGATSITSYTIYESEDGGAFTPFLTNTTSTSATFTGQFGHSYGFYSVATDNSGDVQPTPSGAQSKTYLAAPPTSTVNPLPATTETTTFTVTWGGSQGVGATSVASYTIYESEDGGPFTPFLTGTGLTSTMFTGQFGHSYGFYSVATDNLGDVQPTPTSAQATTDLAQATVPTPTPLVSVENVQLTMSSKHQVTQLLVTFTGALDAQEADQTGIYRLAFPGKKGSYTARNAVIIRVRSATYSAADRAVALVPTKPFSLSKGKLQLLINGSSLQDITGRYIDGANEGQPGSDAVILVSKNGAIID
jgi:hypothetical protein